MVSTCVCAGRGVMNRTKALVAVLIGVMMYVHWSSLDLKDEALKCLSAAI